MIRRDLVVTALLAFCLATLLFMVVPTRSQGFGEYDPWSDIDGDGTIGILDVVQVTNKYATTGDPTRNVNVTNWPPSLGSSNPNYTTYEQNVFKGIPSDREGTLFNITGRGKMKYLMLLVDTTSTVTPEPAGPFRIYVDGALTITLDSTGANVFYASTGQVAVPRIIMELYDTANHLYKWGIELDSYFGTRLVVTYENTGSRINSVNALILYEQ
jgi:hypothetical protein